jgi:hydroxyacylglutathione hydrolase
MKLEQIYTSCIAQAAYYLESNGEVAIFDPLREVQSYIDKANSAKASIKYVFETHFHADFVSGHLDLAKKTGAKIVYGPDANPNFDSIIAIDNQEFRVGECIVKSIHTPGHTLESTCYLIIDEEGKQHGIITGDTLFIGDVGRPDLAQKMAINLTQKKLAAMLFDSLRTKIMPLPNHLIVYPSHGAGSACGKNMSKETTDTLGNQKSTNYALRANMTKEEFVSELLNGLSAPPAYFPQNVALNSQGYGSLDVVLENGLKPLLPVDFKKRAENDDVIVLDVRHENEYIKSHIPRSIYIGINGNFAPWVGSLIGNVNQQLLLVIPDGKEKETLTRLSRVGFDHVIGYLKGGISAWENEAFEVDTINSISPQEFESDFDATKIILDARKPSEYEAEHIENAINYPLDSIYEHLSQIKKQNTFYLHCAGGYRSVMMASVLKRYGIHDFINIAQGISGIKNTTIPITNFVCSDEK